MPVKIKENCEGAGDCVPVCPQNCLVIESDKAKVNEEECIDCSACIDACTHGAIETK